MKTLSSFASRRTAAVAGSLAASVLALGTACSSGETAKPPASGSPIATVGLTLANGKITPAAAAGANVSLTGTLTNSTQSPVTIVGGTTTAASQIQVVSGPANSASPISGGLTIEPGKTQALTLPGTRFQLNKLTRPLTRNEVVRVVLLTPTGNVAAVTATVR